MTFRHALAAIAVTLGFMSTASAGPILTDLTPDDYITIGNLQWAYAAPVSAQNWYSNNTLYQADLHAGWREATDLEWLTHPTASSFGGKCAAAYWNSSFTHCDFGDSLAQHWQAGNTGNTADLLYVRDVVIASVPEPATTALLGLGLLGFVTSRRKSAKSKAV